MIEFREAITYGIYKDSYNSIIFLHNSIITSIPHIIQNFKSK